MSNYVELKLLDTFLCLVVSLTCVPWHVSLCTSWCMSLSVQYESYRWVMTHLFISILTESWLSDMIHIAQRETCVMTYRKTDESWVHDSSLYDSSLYLNTHWVMTQRYDSYCTERDMRHDVQRERRVMSSWLISLSQYSLSHDSVARATWLICTCDMTRSYMCHDSLICVTGVAHPVLIRHVRGGTQGDMTNSYVWHDTFTRVAWFLHVCDMTHSYVWRDSFIHVTWLI